MGTLCRNANRARVAAARDPAEGDEARAQGGAEGASNVGAALGPVDALSREAATRAPQAVDVDAESGEPVPAFASEFIIAFATDLDDLAVFEALREFDGDAASEMVVAGARPEHFVAFRRAVEGGWMRFGGDGAEGFECEGHFRSRKTVVAVSSCTLHGKQAAIDQLRKMCACRLRGNVRGEGESSGGASAPIQQVNEYGCAGRFADEFPDASEWVGWIHALSVARDRNQQFMQR
jgi:hypothetical protein